MEAFCRIALAKGFVTSFQVARALEAGRESPGRMGDPEAESGGIYQQLIGAVLIELGYMTPAEVMEVEDTFDCRPPRGLGANHNRVNELHRWLD
jgi:hypothetical protein